MQGVPNLLDRSGFCSAFTQGIWLLSLKQEQRQGVNPLRHLLPHPMMFTEYTSKRKNPLEADTLDFLSGNLFYSLES